MLHMIKIFKNKGVIYCENLTKIYKNKKQEVRAIDGISFGLKRGEIVGNGAGKTTTIKCLCHLITPGQDFY